MADLAYLSAGEALAMFRSRELSPAEVLDALIARDEAIGSDVNAFAWRFFDDARAAAKRAEARYMERGPAPRPLEGIAVAVKENQAIAGLPLTHASLLLADAVASATAPVPQRVLDAGGIVHARTTMAEFGTHWATHSRLFGVTRNPWNRDYDVGGSSGGSAAALAAGTATLATGGDFAGSLRTPAACCGVVGYKPPYGRVPILPTNNFDTYLAHGPMARTVADCALLPEVHRRSTPPRHRLAARPGAIASGTEPPAGLADRALARPRELGASRRTCGPTPWPRPTPYVPRARWSSRSRSGGTRASWRRRSPPTSWRACSSSAGLDPRATGLLTHLRGQLLRTRSAAAAGTGRTGDAAGGQDLRHPKAFWNGITSWCARP